VAAVRNARRIANLERRLKDGEPPTLAFLHLMAILGELAALRASAATHLRAGVRVEPEDVPRQVLGAGYTHGQLVGLAVSRAVEAGKVPTERAHDYVDHMRAMCARNGKDPDAVAEARGEGGR
jgi:hypothetical protein